jgi:hypothetical protein
VRGEPRVLQHLEIDLAALLQVESPPREVLQPEIPIPIDRRILEPRREIGCRAGIGGHQLSGRAEADLAQRLRDSRVGGRIEPRLQGVDVNPQRFDLPNNEIIAVSLFVFPGSPYLETR